MSEHIPGHPDWHDALSGEELERVDRLARRTERVSAGNVEMDISGGGIAVADAEEEGVWVRVGGQPTSSLPYYGFTQVTYDESVNDWLDAEGGLVGADDGSGYLAVESTGNAGVAPGTRVFARPLSPLRLSFTLPAAGSLTVQDTNGITNVSPCSTLVFDNANGLFASDQGGGTAEVQVNLKRREVHPTGSYSIPDTTFTDVTAFSLTLYEAGTYLLYANYYLDAKLGPTAVQGRVFVRLVAGPSGSLVALAGSVVQASQPAVIAGGVAQDWQQTMNLSPILYTAANNSEVVQVQAYKADGPWTSCNMHADGGTTTSSCRLGALKVGV